MYFITGFPFRVAFILLHFTLLLAYLHLLLFEPRLTILLGEPQTLPNRNLLFHSTLAFPSFLPQLMWFFLCSGMCKQHVEYPKNAQEYVERNQMAAANPYLRYSGVGSLCVNFLDVSVRISRMRLRLRGWAESKAFLQSPELAHCFGIPILLAHFTWTETGYRSGWADMLLVLDTRCSTCTDCDNLVSQEMRVIYVKNTRHSMTSLSWLVMKGTLCMRYCWHSSTTWIFHTP